MLRTDATAGIAAGHTAHVVAFPQRQCIPATAGIINPDTPESARETCYAATIDKQHLNAPAAAAMAALHLLWSTEKLTRLFMA